MSSIIPQTKSLTAAQKSALRTAVRKLPENIQLVIIKRFGLNSAMYGKPITMVAREEGISTRKVRELVETGLKLLKEPAQDIISTPAERAKRSLGIHDPVSGSRNKTRELLSAVLGA